MLWSIYRSLRLIFIFLENILNYFFNTKLSIRKSVLFGLREQFLSFTLHSFIEVFNCYQRVLNRRFIWLSFLFVYNTTPPLLNYHDLCNNDLGLLDIFSSDVASENLLNLSCRRYLQLQRFFLCKSILQTTYLTTFSFYFCVSLRKIVLLIYYKSRFTWIFLAKLLKAYFRIQNRFFYFTLKLSLLVFYTSRTLLFWPFFTLFFHNRWLCRLFTLFITQIFFNYWIHLGAAFRFDWHSISIDSLGVLSFGLVNCHTAWSFKTLFLLFIFRARFLLFVCFYSGALTHFDFLLLFGLLFTDNGALTMSDALSFWSKSECWFGFQQFFTWIASEFLLLSQLFFQMLGFMMRVFIFLKGFRDIYWVKVLIVLMRFGGKLCFGSRMSVRFTNFWYLIGFQVLRFGVYFMCGLFIWLIIFGRVILR